jgi:hypothetical protein
VASPRPEERRIGIRVEKCKNGRKRKRGYEVEKKRRNSTSDTGEDRAHWRVATLGGDGG